MSEYVAAYDAPTAAFDREFAGALVPQVATFEQNLRGVSTLALVPQLLSTAAEELGAESTAAGAANRVGGYELEGSAVIRVIHYCDGPSQQFTGPAGVVDPELEAGTATIALGATSTGFAASARAHFDACVDSSREVMDLSAGAAEESAAALDVVESAPVVVDGYLDLYLGEADGFDDLDRRDYLFHFRGLLLPASPKVLDFDFRRLKHNRGWEVQITDQSGGRVLYSFSEKAKVGRVRASNGNFRCELEERACIRESDGKRVEW